LPPLLLRSGGLAYGWLLLRLLLLRSAAGLQRLPGAVAAALVLLLQPWQTN
jgi:hypothetical protein